MRFIAAFATAVSLLTLPALAADDEVTPPVADASAPQKPALLDDAAVDAQFQCPETLADAEARADALQHYVDWARDAHPDWSFRKRLDVRYGLLRRHACAQTLANIATAGRPPFGP